MSVLLSEEDLNDYISPGLACVKPTKISSEAEKQSGALEVGKEPNELEKVSITLQDCLACSGCITSSEELLLGQQSHTAFLKAWKNLPADKPLVVSVAPQTRISMAHYFGMTQETFDGCFLNLLSSYFKAKFVVGTQVGRETTVRQTNRRLEELRGTQRRDPVLCSVCPGFVLYVEKTKPDLVPFLLNVKSPQQITGALLKRTISNMYHLSVMPCFDKKLEAAREDGTGEVDCVITPKEVVTMLRELSININDYASASDLTYILSPPGWDPAVHWGSSVGSSSGGYAFQYLLGLQSSHPGSKIVTLQGKNTDVVEHRLLGAEDTILASSSEVYGFRNIQNMVRKLLNGSTSKRNPNLIRRRNATKAIIKISDVTVAPIIPVDPFKTEFIEVMACPGGCINGGGLLNGEKSSTERKRLLEGLNGNYKKLPRVDIRQDVTPTTESYMYKFQPIERPSDVVSVGNTW